MRDITLTDLSSSEGTKFDRWKNSDFIASSDSTPHFFTAFNGTGTSRVGPVRPRSVTADPLLPLISEYDGAALFVIRLKHPTNYQTRVVEGLYDFCMDASASGHIVNSGRAHYNPM